MHTTNNILFINDPEETKSDLEIALETYSDVRVIKVKSFTSAMSLADKQQIDIIIMNVELQDENKTNFIKWVRQKFPKTIIILFSLHPEIFSPIFQKLFAADFFIDTSKSTKKLRKIIDRVSKFHRSSIYKKTESQL